MKKDYFDLIQEGDLVKWTNNRSSGGLFEPLGMGYVLKKHKNTVEVIWQLWHKVHKTLSGSTKVYDRDTVNRALVIIDEKGIPRW